MLGIRFMDTPNHRCIPLFELLKNIFIIVAVVFLTQAFVVRPFLVHGISMYPTFNELETIRSDYLLVEKVGYHFNKPKRGDVVVAYGAHKKGAEAYIIKRIIGLPEETITLKGSKVIITDGSNRTFELQEPYINENDAIQYDPSQTVTLGSDEYYLMGDNRNYSFDSRVVGAFSEDELAGQVFVRLFPLNKITYRPGAIAYNT